MTLSKSFRETNPWLEVDQYCSGNVSRVVTLVVENVFAVATLGREIFEIAVLTDAVLLAKLLPELTPNLWATLKSAISAQAGRLVGVLDAMYAGSLTAVAALASLDRNDFPAQRVSNSLQTAAQDEINVPRHIGWLHNVRRG